MKKILVVLLVFTVVGGVFAQWGVSGNVEIGTRIDFDPRDNSLIEILDDDGNNSALANGIAWNTWDRPRGRMTASYGGQGYSFAMQFNTRGDPSIELAFAKDNFKAQVATFGLGFVSGNSFMGEDSEAKLKWLWGEYYVLDGMLTFDVAYRSPDTQYWFSDTVGTFGSSRGQGSKIEYVAFPTTWQSGWASQGNIGHDFFGDRGTWANVDQATHFRAALNIAGFDIGLMVPQVFGNGNHGTAGANAKGNYSDGSLFIEDALKKSIFGAKVNLYPIEFAAQFLFEQYGIYFGGKFFLGPVTIGASFMGILGDPVIDTSANAHKRMKVGGQVAYDAGQMGAGVKASFDRVLGYTTPDSKGYVQQIAFNPYFFFKIIPSHLGFKLDTGFYFSKEDDGSKKTESDIHWAVQPALFWNFNGTGANTGYSWGSSTGSGNAFMARYRMISGLASYLDLVFAFSM